MRKKLTKVFIPIFLSIIFGSISANFVYKIYDKKINDDLNGEKLYLIQSGAYSSYDSMVNNTLLSNYVYYEDDDGLYKSIIGITMNKENVDKIKNTYKEKVLVSEYYSKDKYLNKKIENYDKELNQTLNENDIKKIINEMLKIYKDKKTILIQMNS